MSIKINNDIPADVSVHFAQELGKIKVSLINDKLSDCSVDALTVLKKFNLDDIVANSKDNVILFDKLSKIQQNLKSLAHVVKIYVNACNLVGTDLVTSILEQEAILNYLKMQDNTEYGAYVSIIRSWKTKKYMTQVIVSFTEQCPEIIDSIIQALKCI